MASKRSKLDQTIEGGATFDWFTPLISLLSSDARISVPREDQNYATSALDRAGISYKRTHVQGDYFGFDVAKNDKDAAHAALTKAGLGSW